MTTGEFTQFKAVSAMSLIDAIEAFKRIFYRLAPSWLFQAALALVHTISGTRAMGFFKYRRFRAMKNAASTQQAVRIDVAPILHPVYFRPGTSDVDMITENLIRKLYLYFTPPEPVRFIIDAGANIGDSTTLYLSAFPRATVVALEPDRSNFEILRLNCAGYGDRLLALNQGLWNKEAYLKVNQPDTHCRISVSEVLPTARYDCAATTIPAIMTLVNKHMIDILKVDIEGAETVVFGDTSDEWLCQVRRIFIEVHDAKGTQIVLERARKHNFAVKRYRSIYILYRES